MIGFAGSSRVHNVLFSYEWLYLPLKERTNEETIFKYLVLTIVPDIIQKFKENNLLIYSKDDSAVLGEDQENEMWFDGEVIIALYGKIYHIASNFSVESFVDDFTAIGHGSSFALGSFRETYQDSFSKESVHNALLAAEANSAFVGGPFNFLSTKEIGK